MSVIYFDNISHFGLPIFFFFLTDNKVRRVWVCSVIVYYAKKWIKETVLSIVSKMISNVEMLTGVWRVYYEQNTSSIVV